MEPLLWKTIVFPSKSPEKLASPVVVTNLFQVEPKEVTKVDPGAQEGVVGVNDVEEDIGATAGSDNQRLRPDVYGSLRSKKESKLNKALLGLRITASVLCLASFSVLAADKKKGWALREAREEAIENINEAQREEEDDKHVQHEGQGISALHCTD